MLALASFLVFISESKALVSPSNDISALKTEYNNPMSIYNSCHVKNNTAEDWFNIGWCGGFIQPAYFLALNQLKNSTKANKKWLISAEKNGIATFNTKEFVNLFSFFILNTERKELDKMNTGTFIQYTIYMFGALHDRPDGKPRGLDDYIKHHKLEFEEIAGDI